MVLTVGVLVKKEIGAIRKGGGYNQLQGGVP